MREIKIKFEINNEIRDYIIEKLKNEYVFLETDKPDFVLFEMSRAQNCFRYNCVRILYIGENLRPDFNLFDYAIGFDNLQFGDRYLHRPQYLGPHFLCDFERAKEKHLYEEDLYLSKSKFCNFVVKNGRDAYPIRAEMFDKLCSYKKVDSAGKYKNNMNGYIVPMGKLDEFRKDYKFSLAFENSSTVGYTTEKIIRAWSGVTIPIYWGDPDIEKYFNAKAFVNVMAYPSLKEAVEKIIEIDQDDKLYLKIMKEPIMLEDSPVKIMQEDDYILNFFRNIFKQDPRDAIRRTNTEYGWGHHYETRMRVQHEMEQDKLVRLTYKLKRIGKLLKG